LQGGVYRCASQFESLQRSTKMNATTLENSTTTSATGKSLWAAVGVLSVAVVAMGATLVRIQSSPEEPRLAVLSSSSANLAALEPSSAAEPQNAKPTDLPEPVAAAAKSKTQIHKKTAVSHTTQQAVKASGTEFGAANDSFKSSVNPSVKPVCANCGTVTSVTPITREGEAKGVGAIAGGVLGAVVGNQVGGGDGKTLATILGAVGGGMAGNAVEKKMQKVTVYQINVLMEDGRTRRLEQSTPASVGAKVILEGNKLQMASN
jgi:outer membrane lipoprotein SlyB